MTGPNKTWYSFISVTGWGHRGSQTPPRAAVGHIRSLSNLRYSSSRSASPLKSSSTSTLPDISALASDTPSKNSRGPDENDLSTIPDPRIRNANLSDTAEGNATPQHPDLSDEVATLSQKLISAINHQGALDDQLSDARHELEVARNKIQEMELTIASQTEMLQGDVWVRRSAHQHEKDDLERLVKRERRKREDVEKEKKKIEQELENLTAALFEEANKMVINAKEEARKEHEVLQRKNDQLKSQLADTEGLLKSQQEQLVELKLVMEQMSSEHDDHSNPTCPSSPGFREESKDEDPSTADNVPTEGPLELVEPSHPLSFSHLLRPVLRTDLVAYQDFRTLVRTSKASHARVSSGSYSGLNSLSLGLGASPYILSHSNGSTSSIPTPTSATTSNPQSPNTPASSVSASSMANVPPPPALKDTKFYKRVVVEDIEPTLRLDLSPSLSWLARRSILSAISEGSLLIEPVATNTPFAEITKPQFYPCSLCGEIRRGNEFLRTHRFATSDSDSAQRYPLCKHCLVRVRSTCDFLAFLRLLKDGHWRADSDEAIKAAWEECIRLREHMFWSRLGGGVIPVSQSPRNSLAVECPPTSHDSTPVPEEPEEAKPEAEEEVTPKAEEEEVTPKAEEEAKPEAEEGVKPEVEEEVKPKVEEEVEPKVEEEVKPEAEEEVKPETQAEAEAETRPEAVAEEPAETTQQEQTIVEDANKEAIKGDVPENVLTEKTDSNRHSMQSFRPKREEPKRLSLTIPKAGPMSLY